MEVPFDEALYLQEYGKLSKVGYTTLRLSFLPYGLVLPPYDAVAKHKVENIVPKEQVGHGISCNISEVNKKNLRRSTRIRMGLWWVLVLDIVRVLS